MSREAFDHLFNKSFENVIQKQKSYEPFQLPAFSVLKSSLDIILQRLEKEAYLSFREQ